MFIKLNTFTEEGLEDSESIYHCIGATLMRSLQVAEKDFPRMCLKMVFGNGKEEEVLFDCQNVSLFYMNDNGKTVDHKKW